MTYRDALLDPASIAPAIRARATETGHLADLERLLAMILSAAVARRLASGPNADVLRQAAIVWLAERGDPGAN